MERILKSNLALSIAMLLMIAAVPGAFLASAPGRSHAASGRSVDLAQPGISTWHGSHSQMSFKPQPFNFISNHNHLLYVDDGTCPDSIDVYRLGNPIIHVGNFPNSGCNASTHGVYAGDQSIAITKANQTHGACLVFGDAGHGFVDSFPINANGSLGTQVSHVAVAANVVSDDIHIDPSGNFVYVAGPTFGPSSNLEAYTLGTGCTLTTLAQLATHQHYISFTLTGHKSLVTVDTNTGIIDTYILTARGFKLRGSVPGQISSPDSITSQTAHTTSGTVTNVFTGQAASHGPLVQGGQYSTTSGAFTPLRGSPTGDPAGSGGAAVIFSNAFNLLIQGETFSGTLAIYGVQPGTPGMPGTITFKQETPLAIGGENPVAFALLSSTLFVSPGINGDVEACNLSLAGVSGCQSIVVLTNTSGLQGGIAVL